MDEKKSLEGKRRAIEGILGSSREPDPSDIPDTYRPVDIGPSSAPPKSDKKNNTVLLVAGAIVLIGIFAAVLILAQGSILSIFGIEKGGPSPVEQQAAARLAAGGDAVDRESYDRLLGFNKDLEATLESEREVSAGLRDDVDKLTAEIERLRGAADEAPDPEAQNRRISELENRLGQAIERADKLERDSETLRAQMRQQNTADDLLIKRLEADNEQLNEKVAELQRDLAASTSELQVLRSNADEGSSASEQLDAVNLEYRRVLDRLREAQTAGRRKDDRIEELLEENGVLRQRLAASEEEKEQAASEERLAESQQPATSSTPGVVSPTPRSTVTPEYPSSAVRRKVSGVVRVKVLVSERGEVLQAQVVSSPDPLGALDRAALKAVRAWKFNPATRNGRPIRMYYEVPLNFKL